MDISNGKHDMNSISPRREKKKEGKKHKKKHGGMYVYADSIEIHDKFDKNKKTIFVSLENTHSSKDVRVNVDKVIIDANTPTQPSQKKQRTSHGNKYDVTTKDVETEHNRAIISSIEMEMFEKEISSTMSIFEKVKNIEFYQSYGPPPQIHFLRIWIH